ncbi:MAG: FkbM family methyltransferase [Prosthecobacter sp.]
MLFNDPVSGVNQAFLHKLFASYLRTPDHPCKLRLARWLRRLLGIGKVCASTNQGWMELDPGDLVQMEILRFGAYETATCALFETLVRKGDVFVDVGANVGQYSLLAARLCGPTGRVLALEPNPGIFLAMRRNFALNCLGNIDSLLMAAGSLDSPVSMLEPPPSQLGTSRMAGSSVAGDYWSGGYKLTTILKCLGLARCDVVKIDVEGHENEVLEGLLQDREMRPRHIVFEFIPQTFTYSGCAEAMLVSLRDAGYQLRTVDGQPYHNNMNLPEFNLWASCTEA